MICFLSMPMDRLLSKFEPKSMLLFPFVCRLWMKRTGPLKTFLIEVLDDPAEDLILPSSSRVWYHWRFDEKNGSIAYDSSGMDTTT